MIARVDPGGEPSGASGPKAVLSAALSGFNLEDEVPVDDVGWKALGCWEVVTSASKTFLWLYAASAFAGALRLGGLFLPNHGPTSEHCEEALWVLALIVWMDEEALWTFASIVRMKVASIVGPIASDKASAFLGRTSGLYSQLFLLLGLPNPGPSCLEG